MSVAAPLSLSTYNKRDQLAFQTARHTKFVPYKCKKKKNLELTTYKNWNEIVGTFMKPKEGKRRTTQYEYADFLIGEELTYIRQSVGVCKKPAYPILKVTQGLTCRSARIGYDPFK